MLSGFMSLRERQLCLVVEYSERLEAARLYAMSLKR